MRVSKSQIVHGIAEYVRGEILPKMSDNRAMQIVLSIAANAALSNNKAVDSVFGNGIVKALLEDDGSGTYDIESVAESIKTAVEQFGSFPVVIPAVPLLSPNEITLHLNSGDVDAIRRRIENAI